MMDLIFDVTLSGSTQGGPGNLTLVAPAHDIWDFDYTTVSAWDTDVTASTENELEAAIAAAMGLGTTANPQFHRIAWTGGAITSNMNLTGASVIPDKYGPHILVDGGSYTSVTAEIGITSISNVMFTGFRFERGSGYTQDSIDMKGNGGGRRIGFAENRIGENWAGSVPADYSRFLNHQTGAHNWEITIRDNDVHNLFELVSMRPGKLAVKHNLVRGLRDDFVFVKGSNLGGEAYVYALGNVICDHEDSSADQGFHPDFIQCADNNDGASDEYHVLSQANIFVGSTWQQYPTQAFIVQKQGAANVFRVRTHDDIFLTTGDRGIYLIDEDFQIHRTMFARPPLGGPIPWGRSGAGWTSNNPLDGPIVRTKNWHLTSGPIDFGPYLAGAPVNDLQGWGNLEEPTILADPYAETGPTSYSAAFPNMTGLTWQPSPHQASAKTVMIDNGWSSVTRTKAAIRTWISNTYEPNSAANGQGWVANGFTDPATWF